MKLNDYLREKKISQNNFARLAGLSQSLISRIVRRQEADENPSLIQLGGDEERRKLSHAFSPETCRKISKATGGRVRLR